MSKLHHPALHLLCGLAIASGLSLVGCVSSDDVDPMPSTGGGAGTGGTADTGGTGGGDTGGTGGTGGTVTLRCMGKTAPPAATLADFEALMTGDGVATIGAGTLVGTYVYLDPADLNATKAQALIEGHDPATSTQAVSTTIHSETWGGGMGLWFDMPGCFDATGFTGISFWAKSSSPPASTPAGTVNLGLNMGDTSAPADGGTCDTTPCESPTWNFVVTETWAQFEVRWSEFTPGKAGTEMIPATGDNITGVNFNLGNDSTARDIVFDLDDVAFLTD